MQPEAESSPSSPFLVTTGGGQPFMEDVDASLWNPPAPATVIWRYVSLARFTNMILRRADGRGCLYFPRADLLGDPFEGSLPAMIAKRRAGWTDEAIEQERKTNWGVRRWSFVSCWHIADRESAALWELYSRGEGAVAVRSTYGDLRAALAHSIGHQNISFGIGKVRYIDFADDSLPPPDPMDARSVSALLLKRDSFAHESELRAIISAEPPELPDNPAHYVLKPGVSTRLITPDEFCQDPPVGGIAVPIDIETLVDEVRIGPMQPDWIGETVSGLTLALDYKFAVRKSEMTSDAIF